MFDPGAYYAANREKIRAKQRAYSAANREKIRTRNRAHYAANPEKKRAQHRAYRAANPEKVRARGRKYRAENREKIRARANAYNAKNPEKVQAQKQTSHRNRKYGLTPEEQSAALLRANGRCEMCGKSMTKPCFDHDHDTGRFRGILCIRCNAFEGFVRKRPSLVLELASYLKRTELT